MINHIDTHDAWAKGTLPYERIDDKKLMEAVRLFKGEQLLVLRPFGWHIDGKHIPNAAEHLSREGRLCRTQMGSRMRLWALRCNSQTQTY